MVRSCSAQTARSHRAGVAGSSPSTVPGGERLWFRLPVFLLRLGLRQGDGEVEALPLPPSSGVRCTMYHLGASPLSGDCQLTVRRSAVAERSRIQHRAGRGSHSLPAGCGGALVGVLKPLPPTP